MPQSQLVMYQVEVYRPGKGWEPIGPARARKGRAKAARADLLKVMRASRESYSFTKIRLSMLTGGRSLVIVAEVDI